ncbi:hypothetical protein CH063_10465 [Colletotrichum higginsianum]|uniref:Uncharacterized protein n=5 Tax=Colletotrichum destructivum species complex TaxID=2707350 RepID=H1VHJ6_COLHI|nr:hypothetical protein CH63R_00892 [Colletotrichum higginsianum IMI 349063]KAJ0148313.1 hypothetical protein CTA2_709 [Colletotrichum tanaceti]TID04706.1 hypothetical protein CH35J_002508 [Colletotrichum higginsianum]WQF78100.1 hypothetical protein CDEST_03114 [Colletotrichum destructivum]OBR15712.1 hypothetical protein CH63R_00892 [Colletotrichum higginsianum IMI 349063]TKW51632.1 hypothetical protein CTA1_9367 [Colletotrichum tanaceti]
MPANRPKLAQLATPVTSTFPSETIFSASTPLSARPMSCRDLPIKTPISPPTAYTDFLKHMSLNSPAAFKPSTSGETTPESTPESTPDSLPSTATSEQTDVSCKCEHEHEHKAPATAPAIPPSPFTQLPMSAPPTGANSFPSLKIPPSPAVSHVDSPMSARSPFSARSFHSVFDWDAALKAKRLNDAKKPSRTSVRHIREVVTRTVTYTPRMNPAPKGKRRKVE